VHSLVSELFERHHVAVLRFFRRLTGNPDLAEDLTQEVFVRVVKGISDYHPDGRETGWVFRIARNVLADHYRRQPDRPSSLSDPEALAVSSPPGQLLAFGVQEALNRLPEPERTAFLLREVAGLSYSEVAAVCETSEDGVGSRLFRARRRLRQLLSGRLMSDSRRIFTKD
jgi:RNA polymerase sigma factor (sigma-70 family)